MRGNKCVRAGDPMKSRGQRKRDKAERIRTSNRGKRLVTKMLEVKQRREKKQSNGHVAALMESFVTRRKAVRKAMKRQERANSGAPSESGSRASATPARAPVRTKKTAAMSRALY